MKKTKRNCFHKAEQEEMGEPGREIYKSWLALGSKDKSRGSESEQVETAD